MMYNKPGMIGAVLTSLAFPGIQFIISLIYYLGLPPGFSFLQLIMQSLIFWPLGLAAAAIYTWFSDSTDYGSEKKVYRLCFGISIPLASLAGLGGTLVMNPVTGAFVLGIIPVLLCMGLGRLVIKHLALPL